MLYTTTLTGPLGPMMLAGTETHLTGLWLEGQLHYAAHLPPDAPRRAELPLFARAEHWLNRYFAGDAPSPDGALCMNTMQHTRGLAAHLLGCTAARAE